MTKIITAACTAGCFMMVGCLEQEADVSWWQREEERISLASQLETKKLRLERISPNYTVEDLAEQKELRASLSLRKQKLAHRRKSF